LQNAYFRPRHNVIFEFDSSDNTVRQTTPPRPDLSGARMTVIGVGGGGGNAIGHMLEEQVQGVRFVAANTDVQALRSIEEKHGTREVTLVPLGAEVTRGLGAGACPDKGRMAAEESLREVLDAVGTPDLLFIAAGMGGGTGTGAAPIIARAARERGILTIAIVYSPFAYEGRKRALQAQQGLDHLAAAADTVIVVPNEKLLHVVEAGTSFQDALRRADTVLINAVRGIAGIIVRPGAINTDFADIRTIMGSGGAAIIGCGIGSGENASVEAARAAVENPLIADTSLDGATRLLINVRGASTTDARAIAAAVQAVSDRAHPTSEVIFGFDVDDRMGGSVAVTVIATGFEPLGLEGPSAASPGRPAAAPVVESRDEAANQGEHRLATDPTPVAEKARGWLGRIMTRSPSPVEADKLSQMPSRPAELPPYVRRVD
jgi:cell division protein FtsZ